MKLSTAIERSEHLDGKLILQGADEGIEDVRDGLAWSMVIDETSGKMLLSAAGDGVAFAVFGACTLRQAAGILPVLLDTRAVIRCAT
jgi:hypothetical protein